jgi:DNA helicase-2/ATP-dependent DNA helicase PcrA
MRAILHVLKRIGWNGMALKADEILAPLNEAQRNAVTHIEGPLLTLAGPGSGKTRVVTHRIAYLLDQGISPYSILALTFTNKAAREMKARLDRMVDECPVWMGTFHGYCARFLRRFGEMVGLQPNFTIFDVDDSKSALKKALEIADVSTSHLHIGDIAKRIGTLKNKAIGPEMLEGQVRGPYEKILSKVYPAYQKVLQQFNAVDFDDLLMHTANILRSNPDLRSELDSKHRYILVDEYQDTNVAQYLIVRGLSIEYPNLNVTGDPDQSIYSWRGADISNILSFEKDYPQSVTVRLQQNYRSTPQILSSADCLISNNQRRKSKTLIPVRDGGAKVRFVTYGSDREEADDIAQRIALEILENGAKGKDFAILYRTNAQSRLIEQALLRRKLNYQLIGGFRFYQREEIKDIIAYLRLINNPTDDIAFDRIVNVPVRGLGDKSLEKVKEIAVAREIPMLVALRASLEYSLLSKKAAAGARQFLAIYDQLVDLSTGPLLEVINTLLQKTEYIPYIASRKSETPDESIIGNINELRADAAELDAEPSEGNTLERFLEQITLSSDVDGIADVENKVTLMTLHAAKGLEFENVFVIAVEHGVLPHMRSMDDPAQLEEERRLLFVGITRAKNRLQLSMAKRRGFTNSSMGCPSQFALELPRAELELVDMTSMEAFDISFNEDFEDPQFEGFVEDRDERKPEKTKSFLHDRPRKKKATRSPQLLEMRQQSAAEVEAASTEGPSNVLLSSDELDTSSGASKPVSSSDDSTENGSTVEAIQKQLGKIGLKTGSHFQSITTKEGVGVEQFEAGSIVRHPSYGIGQVESIEGHGMRRMARISFDNGETKTFQLNKSPLQLIEA